MRTSRIYVTLPALAAALAVGAGCSRNDGTVRDTATGDVTVTPNDSAAAAAAATRTASSDEGLAADSEHITAVETRFGPAKDADHAFLRMMADHHEGLIAMTAPVLDQAVNATTQSDARRFHDKQQRELRDMLAMIANKYGESYEPSILPSNRRMLDSLGRATGAAYDTLFYRQVIAHHQQGLEMMGKYLPDLQDAKLKAMAERMRAEHVRETAELEQKI
jgi:hypothetical protein